MTDAYTQAAYAEKAFQAIETAHSQITMYIYNVADVRARECLEDAEKGLQDCLASCQAAMVAAQEVIDQQAAAEERGVRFDAYVDIVRPLRGAAE